MIQIPEHLVEELRRVIGAHLEHAIGDVRTIESHRERQHPDAQEARRRLRVAVELANYVGPPMRLTG